MTGGSVPLSEDYDRWRDDPVTKLVFKALEKAAGAQKEAWDAASWGGGLARDDELGRALRELRCRADAYRSLEELSVEQLMEWLGIEDAE
jgi:hypothetical protein